jgi:hypothetical protein
MRWTLHHQTLPAVALCLGLGTVLQVGAHEGPTRADGRGDVQYVVSCTDAAQAQFHSALALYYSFDWSRGKAVYAEIASLDLRCGMAQWRLAMIAANNPLAGRGPQQSSVQSARAGAAQLRSVVTVVEHDAYDGLRGG